MFAAPEDISEALGRILTDDELQKVHALFDVFAPAFVEYMNIIEQGVIRSNDLSAFQTMQGLIMIKNSLQQGAAFTVPPPDTDLNAPAN